MRARLALVPGEPAGIGPELCVRLAQDPAAEAGWVAFADPAVLRAAAATIGLPLRLIDPDDDPRLPGDLRLHPVSLDGDPPPFGHPDPRRAVRVIAALDIAAEACLSGRFEGLVTGPTHKASLNEGGIAYRGTTERLAAMAGREVVMMLARPGLRVALATTHLPLRSVADAITRSGIETTIRILHASLRDDFGIPAPRICVLGLNPHAGEGGHLGQEEIDVIIPVIQTLRAEGFDLSGPVPADSAFLPGRADGQDAVLAMYHDQGLPVLKSAGLDQAVNITLGLPYPRVAVDHGVALDIAGRGIADPASLRAAIVACATLAQRRAAA